MDPEGRNLLADDERRVEVDLPREEFDWHDEMRFYEPIPKRSLTLLATRDEETA